MMCDVLARQPMPEPLWSTVEVDGDQVPVFIGKTYAYCVAGWRVAYAEVDTNFWRLGAIAVRLERSFGGRPESQYDELGCNPPVRLATAIQKFCEDVRIDRQTFQRFNRTYRVFLGTRTTGITRFLNELPFKHFEVAARLTDSAEQAIDVIAIAYEAGWSANELERRLTCGRPKVERGPKRKKRPKRLRTNPLPTFLSELMLVVERWEPVVQKHEVLRHLLILHEQLERNWGLVDADLPECLRRLAADYSDPISIADAEVM